MCKAWIEPHGQTRSAVGAAWPRDDTNTDHGGERDGAVVRSARFEQRCEIDAADLAQELVEAGALDAYD